MSIISHRYRSIFHVVSSFLQSSNLLASRNSDRVMPVLRYAVSCFVIESVWEACGAPPLTRNWAYIFDSQHTSHRHIRSHAINTTICTLQKLSPYVFRDGKGPNENQCQVGFAAAAAANAFACISKDCLCLASLWSSMPIHSLVPRKILLGYE